MRKSTVTRRTFTAIAAGSGVLLEAEPDTTAAVAAQFLAKWDHAWGNHDAPALAELHTVNAVTVNRFGTLVEGRAATEKALSFLHSEDGPFGHSKFPPLKLLVARRVTADVMIVQTGWQSPVMNPDGKISETKINDMIVTFVLLYEGQTWRASEIDPHNIEKMDLPFSNPRQKS
jgi:ketosteroid isomerase-like protein